MPTRPQIALPGLEARVVETRKWVFVGESNPYGSDPDFALYPHPPNCAGDRLCRVVLGIRRADYLSRYARANLCSGPWGMREARNAARDLTVGARYEGFVLLGAKVAAAFDRPFRPFTIVEPGPFVSLPHPSGRCRVWNEPGAAEMARSVLRRAGAL